MALKRATFYFHTNDQQVIDTRNFIEESGVSLDIRDLDKQPLNEQELSQMLGNWDLRPFINPASRSIEKFHLDEEWPTREELLKMIASDNTLLRRPLIRTPRLLTFGMDRAKISEMLQIDPNGNNGGNGGDDRGGRPNGPSGPTREPAGSSTK